MSTPTVNTANDPVELSTHDFLKFMKFLGRNNLWDQVDDHLKSDGITTIAIGSPPLQSIKKFIVKLLKSSRDQLNTEDLDTALFFANAACCATTLPPDGGTPDGGTTPHCDGGVMPKGSSCTP
jgi:hypothetical protein